MEEPQQRVFVLSAEQPSSESASNKIPHLLFFPHSISTGTRVNNAHDAGPCSLRRYFPRTRGEDEYLTEPTFTPCKTVISNVTDGNFPLSTDFGDYWSYLPR